MHDCPQLMGSLPPSLWLLHIRNGSLLASSDENGLVLLWSVQSMSRIMSLVVLNQPGLLIQGLSFSPNGR